MSAPSDGTWLLCNGQSTVGYPKLAAIVGETVPNYQGMFLRGYGQQEFSQINGTRYGLTSTVYSSGNIGEIQGDATRLINGSINGTLGGIDVNNGVFTNGGNQWHCPIGAGWGFAPIYLNNTLMVPVSNEIRPVNIAVNYYIKAK